MVQGVSLPPAAEIEGVCQTPSSQKIHAKNWRTDPCKVCPLMVTCHKSQKEAWNMMYAFLMMAMTLLGGIVRLAQALRLSVPLLLEVP